MGYPTSVQLIDREKTEQWYVNFPAAIARAMDFKKGEVVEWTIENKNRLTLKRKPKKKKAKKQKRPHLGQKPLKKPGKLLIN
ncbi:MAG: hypothetical protein ABIH69_07435 [bacterium]|nr:hypothetical protein [Candidatus Margulisiibacteriota bacterium]